MGARFCLLRGTVFGKDLVMTCFVIKYVTFSEPVVLRIVTREELGYLLSVAVAKKTSDLARLKFGNGF
jgi:hypothetical protein